MLFNSHDTCNNLIIVAVIVGIIMIIISYHSQRVCFSLPAEFTLQVQSLNLEMCMFVFEKELWNGFWWDIEWIFLEYSFIMLIFHESSLHFSHQQAFKEWQIWGCQDQFETSTPAFWRHMTLLLVRNNTNIDAVRHRNKWNVNLPAKHNISFPSNKRNRPFYQILL